MSRQVHIGLFEHEADLIDALTESRARHLAIVDAFSPYPIHGIDARIGIRRSRLTLVCFFAGLAGLVLGLGFQYWSSASSWPINVGGKPFDSLPAFLPVGFELTVLCGGLATALLLMVRSRLWPGRKSTAVQGVTDDRFALAVTCRDASLSVAEIRALLERHGAIEIRKEVQA